MFGGTEIFRSDMTVAELATSTARTFRRRLCPPHQLTARRPKRWTHRAAMVSLIQS